ncbi:MAG: endolytic transglycosylase MltG, partial [Firmicutes bacterium]|nr:endolytic transglycosylase MltG [Bacillota bacterium]
GWQYLRFQYLPMDAADQSIIEVRVPENSSAHSVATLLKQNGLIRNEKVFLAYCYQKRWETQLKAGLYDLSRSQTLPQIALQIAQGKVKNILITVPEGYTVRQIGELVVKKGICTPEQWAEALRMNYNYDVIQPGIVDNEKRLEGYLFPETYSLGEQTSAQDVIKMMLESFASVWQQDYAAQAATKKMKVGQVITVASLIEREARVPEERKRIAGVIYNRLQKGMPLQIDATVLYSLGEHRETVTYADLKIDSPYNTYLNAGLPPGPIASPGRAAIDAALNPEINNYYYYVAKGDGSHYFSTTYAEHLEAIKKYGQ